MEAIKEMNISGQAKDLVVSVPEQDKHILRELAKTQMSYAQSETNKATEEDWYRHRRFQPGRPMIMVEMDTFEHEIIPPRLKCTSDFGRQIETVLYKQFLNHELFGDDKVVRDYYPVGWKVWFRLFDLEEDVDHAENGSGSELGHHFNPIITNLKEDLPNLKKSVYGLDRQASMAYKEAVEAIIGDILPVRFNGGCLGAVPTQQLVHFMGMENLFMAMYDAPDELKELMNRVAKDYIEFYRFLEEEGLLMQTTGNQHLGQGTLCYTEELSSDLEQYLSKDIWGFMDSQETVGVAPAMFGEFFFPAYSKIAKEFGLLSYGCCEPVHDIWDDYLSTWENLRNVSISPWCDEEMMGDRLRGKNIVYHRKPSPNFLGVDVKLDEDALREHIQKTWDAARGCQLEFAQRDVYTIHNNPDKVRRYVEIIREVCQ